MNANLLDYISQLLLAACCVSMGCQALSAAVVQAPSSRIPPSSTVHSTSPISPIVKTFHKQFRIRRTQASDLDDISKMLAMESFPPSEGTDTWGDKMMRLRAESLLKNQLTHRFAVIEEGRTCLLHGDDLCSLSADPNGNNACQLLWSSHNFKTKLRRAIHNTQETSPWKSHNFDVLPSSDMLRHTMISVETQPQGEVVGFCEIAWLPSPAAPSVFVGQGGAGFQRTNQDERFGAGSEALDIPESHCEETPSSYCGIYGNEVSHFAGDEKQFSFSQDRHWESSLTPFCAPAILNLITSQAYRRRGIASRILNFASKYTQSQWCCHDMSKCLGLYVHPANTNAIRLYRKHGFSLVPSSEDEDSLLYLIQRR